MFTAVQCERVLNTCTDILFLTVKLYSTNDYGHVEFAAAIAYPCTFCMHNDKSINFMA